MKLVIVIALALVAMVVAEKEPVQIISSEYDLNPDGSYKYLYETADGTKREEVGTLKQSTNEKNEPQTILVVRGNYVYINKEGYPETVSYSADENGFKAEGDSIPKPL